MSRGSIVGAALLAALGIAGYSNAQTGADDAAVATGKSAAVAAEKSTAVGRQFVDANKDGICDRYAQNGRGAAYRDGSGRGRGVAGNRGGRSYGPGRGSANGLGPGAACNTCPTGRGQRGRWR